MNEGTEMARTDGARPTALVELMDLQDRVNVSGVYATSIVGKDMTTAKRLMKCFGKNTHDGEKWGDKTFELVDWLAHPVEMVKPETGEVSTSMRVVLMNEKGETLAFVSDGVFKSLARLVSILGAMGIQSPIPVKVASVRTRAGRTAKFLEIA